MALYLINGLPGTGKTTVCHALRLLGVGAWDADEDDLACWRGADGVPVPDPPPHQRDAAFIASHTRDIPPEAVARLASTTTGEPGFLCGDPENATELYPFFAALFALDADDRTIIHRLVTREGNNWGKAPTNASAFSLLLTLLASTTPPSITPSLTPPSLLALSAISFLRRRLCARGAGR
jgi:hypothetical protein